MSKLTWLIIGLVIGVVGLGLILVNLSYYYGSYYGGYPLMMNRISGNQYPRYAPTNYQYYYYSGFTYDTYPIKYALNMSNTVPSYVHVYRSNNTIVLTSSNIDLVVLAMMGDDAVNMTKSTPPPYAHGDVFVIYGLINPTLIVPAGAVIHVLFINLDDDMYHNFIVTTVPPPYSYNVMPYVAMRNGMGPQMVQNMEWLPPANYNTGYAYGYEYTVVFNEPGTYWYICTYPGHAEAGMYGEVVVR